MYMLIPEWKCNGSLGLYSVSALYLATCCASEYPKKGSYVGYFRGRTKPFKFAVEANIGYKIYNQKKYPKKGC